MMLRTNLKYTGVPHDSASEDWSDDGGEASPWEDDEAQVPLSQRNSDRGDVESCLQIVDLQTLETDNASSPYSYAFRIDAFARKISASDGEFRCLGDGKYLRGPDYKEVQLEEIFVHGDVGSNLFEYYFQEIWPCYPILDKDALYHQMVNGLLAPTSTLRTAIYFAAASVYLHRSESDNAVSSPGLSPGSIPGITPELVESLRSKLTTDLINLSNPILEPRISTLQTLVLLCLHDIALASEQCAAMISDTVRIAQYVLLHRALPNNVPRDKFLRKHLWWTIFLLEVWTSARDHSTPTVNLTEIDAAMPIESEEPDHQMFTALVALTRILLDALHFIYSPTANPANISGEVVRLRDWLMVWYGNLPDELLVIEDAPGGYAADFLLAGSHAVIILLYSPFAHEQAVKLEIDRSRGIIQGAMGRLGGTACVFGTILTAIGDISRKYGQ
jgi:Fungal specific transcription factor domain